MIYAVNKRTKEHRIVEDHERYLVGEWHAVHADPDGWIEWHGGECPLSDGHLCDVRHRDGDEGYRKEAGLPGKNIGRGPATAEDWSHDGVGGDIIAYRPALNDSAKPEPPAWDVGGLPPVGCECEFDTNDEWKRCVVIAHIGGWAAFYYPDENIPSDGPNIYVNNKDFRPIRSEEDRAIRAMHEAFMGATIEEYGSGGMAGVYQAIRDGKVPGVKLTGGE